jgi:hypothetical protein
MSFKDFTLMSFKFHNFVSVCMPFALLRLMDFEIHLYADLLIIRKSQLDTIG